MDGLVDLGMEGVLAKLQTSGPDGRQDKICRRSRRFGYVLRFQIVLRVQTLHRRQLHPIVVGMDATDALGRVPIAGGGVAPR